MNAKDITIDDVSSGSKRFPFFNTIKYIFVFKEGIKMRVVTRTSLGHDRK